MSPAAGWILAVAAIFFAIMVAPTAIDIPALWGFIVFLILIAVSCLSSLSRPIAIRIIAATVFILYVWYLISTIGQPFMPRAIAGFIILGLPAGYVAVIGKYPSWGRGAAAFNGSQRKYK